jgi:predicted PhzF superfamily epimerase YddE/YHI9
MNNDKDVALYQVDAFTAKPFGGNPAAVCLLESLRGADWMQKVAAEMNLSETAFLWPVKGGYSLRWFTPEVEVPLCGHATLASAHVLFESGREKADTVAFETQGGRLLARRAGAGIELDFPALGLEKAEPAAEVVGALPVEVRNTCAVIYPGSRLPTCLLELCSDQAVRELTPRLAGLRRADAPAILVTARSADPDFDFVSRFFAPGVGIDEDPVTGSAHCALAPYWSERLDKSELRAFQASKRGGVIDIRIEGDRVFLRGQAVTVLQGNLLV